MITGSAISSVHAGGDRDDHADEPYSGRKLSILGGDIVNRILKEYVRPTSARVIDYQGTVLP